MQSNHQRILLTVLAGALLGFSLPPVNAEWLGWIALAPLLVAVMDRKPLAAVGQGMLAGAVCALLHFGWSADADAMRLCLAPFVGIAVVLGLTAAAGSVLRRRIVGIPWIAAIAAAGTTAEWLTSLTPLPVNLAMCEFQSRLIPQLASITGIWGISFLIWWTGAAIADFAVRRSARALIMSTIVFAAANAAGYGLLTSSSHGTEPTVRVA
ncbi:MAG TPA: hypothetical protein VFJ58_00715, partial [Armatimonadota bacterium]|nr:hypothetical protein [Armatimonadota bacterium]